MRKKDYQIRSNKVAANRNEKNYVLINTNVEAVYNHKDKTHYWETRLLDVDYKMNISDDIYNSLFESDPNAAEYIKYGFKAFCIIFQGKPEYEKMYRKLSVYECISIIYISGLYYFGLLNDFDKLKKFVIKNVNKLGGNISKWFNAYKNTIYETKDRVYNYPVKFSLYGNN